MAVPVAVPVAEIVPASGAAALEGVTVAGLAEAPSAVAVSGNQVSAALILSVKPVAPSRMVVL